MSQCHNVTVKGVFFCIFEPPLHTLHLTRRNGGNGGPDAPASPLPSRGGVRGWGLYLSIIRFAVGGDVAHVAGNRSCHVSHVTSYLNAAKNKIEKIQGNNLPKTDNYNEKRRNTFTTAFLLVWRKVRDSNPRYPKRVYRISSPARSFTLPTFLVRYGQKLNWTTCPEGLRARFQHCGCKDSNCF